MSGKFPLGPSAAASFGVPLDPYYYDPNKEDAQNPFVKENTRSSLMLRGTASNMDVVSPSRPRSINFDDVILDAPESLPFMKSLKESPHKTLEEPEMRNYFAKFLLDQPSTPKTEEKLKAAQNAFLHS